MFDRNLKQRRQSGTEEGTFIAHIVSNLRQPRSEYCFP